MNVRKQTKIFIANYLLDLSKLTYGSGFLAAVLSKQSIYGIMSFGLLIVLFTAALYVKKGFYGNR